MCRARSSSPLDAHDIGLLKGGRIVFVNTLYNCLATPSERHSFTPVWKPPFISKIVKEDRCHLNGLAMEEGVPRYVTAVSKSDTIDGWRDRRFDGGIIVDVQSGEIVIGGLSMPHSPRVYRGKLFVLNSGTGELGWIELRHRQRRVGRQPGAELSRDDLDVAQHGPDSFGDAFPQLGQEQVRVLLHDRAEDEALDVEPE